MISESELTPDYLSGVFDVALGKAFPWFYNHDDPDPRATEAKEIVCRMSDYPNMKHGATLALSERDRQLAATLQHAVVDGMELYRLDKYPGRVFNSVISVFEWAHENGVRVHIKTV